MNMKSAKLTVQQGRIIINTLMQVLAYSLLVGLWLDQLLYISTSLISDDMRI